MPGTLLSGTKEFYRDWMGVNPNLADICESASREVGPANIKWESFTSIAYEALVKDLIKRIRPAEREKFRQRILAESRMSATETESNLAERLFSATWTSAQAIWDRLFMIDLYPENRERFGVDMRAIVEIIMKDNLGGSTRL
jgi:hypothetical protein